MGDDATMHAADAARDYYNSADVDGFYTSVWGGEDIHTGIYEHLDEPVARATRRADAQVAARVADLLGPGRTVLDLGSGYGGAARHLAQSFGCRVVALNISDVQNRRHRELNARHGLDTLIDVIAGSFQDIPAPDGRFDVVWTQEALVHSGDRAHMLSEAVRVLAPGGALVLTDVMAADDAHQDALRPVCERLNVTDLATPNFVREQLARLGLGQVRFDDLSENLLPHYARLTAEVQRNSEELTGAVGEEYLDRLRTNLPLWVHACENGLLSWGIFHGRR
ncbi:SAM-dependent methyltransferase [Streptantibioticus ferralitis]|uniref:Methyltransferase domain-containing protein n=1 Tax=Streptantibioticus ferralitis TaxID=236510 RepID=A0ABT5ZAG3_9ACTN|nr:methyltransferase domain-containing protein [Streptantibioticus ferralitis]MDF2260055.1 methyltransferase domain-containing protein [Streptantibioticus ferralitis]